MGALTRELVTVDLAVAWVRELSRELHAPKAQAYKVLHPQGAHALAAGLTAPVTVDIRGHAGYYAAGMNEGGTVTVHGRAGTGPMSAFMAQAGRPVVCGDAGDGLGDSIYNARLYVRGRARPQPRRIPSLRLGADPLPFRRAQRVLGIREDEELDHRPCRPRPA